MARHTVEQARSTRERIVWAAAAAFAKQGFTRPSLAQIALTAGVTRGAVYVHFKGRRDLFNAVCDLIDWPSLNEQFLTTHADEEGPLGELRRTIHGWMIDIDSNPVKRCVLDIVLHKTEWTEENAELLNRLHRSNTRVARQIHLLLNEAARKGDISLPISTEEASVTLQAALLGVVSAGLRFSTTEALASRGDWLVTSLLALPEV